MKNSIITLVSSAAVCTTAMPLESRQESTFLSSLGKSFPGLGQGLGQVANAMGAMKAPMKKAHKVDILQPSVSRPGAERIRIWYGPYVLRGSSAKTGGSGNAHSMDPAGTAWNYIVGADFPRDITILRANATTLFEDGTKADITRGVYNHHQMFVDTNKKTPVYAACEGSTLPKMSLPTSLFLGGSEDKGDVYYSTPDGMFDSGYYVGANDSLYMGGDVVNYKAEEQTVFSVTELEFIRGKPSGFLDTIITPFAVNMCNGFAEMLAVAAPTSKKFTISGKPMVVNTDGYIVAVRGHVHDGGVNVQLRVNGNLACDSKAIYGSSGEGDWKTIDHMVQCVTPIKINRGDKLTMESSYDFEKYVPRTQHGGGMGEVMALLNINFAS